MKIQESAENYLETIFNLKRKNGYVRSIDIVNEMNFSKPSVSNAMKQFRENGYITVDSCGHIELTNSGLEIAEKIAERHQLLANYLIALGVNEEIAYEDACRMEHYVSQESFEKLKAHYESILSKSQF